MNKRSTRIPAGILLLVGLALTWPSLGSAATCTIAPQTPTVDRGGSVTWSATVTAASSSESLVALGVACFVSSVKVLIRSCQSKSVAQTTPSAWRAFTAIGCIQVLPAVSKADDRCSLLLTTARRAHARLWGCLPHGPGSIPCCQMRSRERA